MLFKKKRCWNYHANYVKYSIYYSQPSVSVDKHTSQERLFLNKIVVIVKYLHMLIVQYPA